MSRSSIAAAWFLAVALLAVPGSTAAQPSDALDRARQLNAEVVRRYQDGRSADAIPLAREALKLREAALGPHHPDVAQSLKTIGGIKALFGRNVPYRRAAPNDPVR